MGNSRSGRRTPRQAKIIRGTFRKDRNPENEPEPSRIFEVPNPPRSLGKAGRELWRKLAGEMVQAGILTMVDTPALEILCSAWETFREARHAVYHRRERRRTLAAYLDGRPPRLQGELQTMKAAWSIFRAYCAEFGLSPSSRNRIDLKPPKPAEVDPMEKLLDEGR